MIELRSLEALVSFSEKFALLDDVAFAECEQMRDDVRRHVRGFEQIVRHEEINLTIAIEAASDLGEDDDADAYVADIEEARSRLTEARNDLSVVADAAHSFSQALIVQMQIMRERFRGGKIYLQDRIDAINQIHSVLDARHTSASSTQSTRVGGLAAGEQTLLRAERQSQTPAMNGAGLADLPGLPGNIRWVPISEIDFDSIPSDLEFKTASKQEIKSMMETFEQDVIPALHENPFLSVDDFELYHAVERDELGKSARFAYECLLGSFGSSDVIALDALGYEERNKRGITSGRHRILIARQLGWTHVPARILGEDIDVEKLDQT